MLLMMICAGFTIVSSFALGDWKLCAWSSIAFILALRLFFVHTSESKDAVGPESSSEQSGGRSESDYRVK